LSRERARPGGKLPLPGGVKGQGTHTRGRQRGRWKEMGIRLIKPRLGREGRALLVLGLALLAFLLSLLWEGPRTLYVHAVVTCLDCIGLI